jgi:hypothetical protein
LDRVRRRRIADIAAEMNAGLAVAVDADAVA